MDLTAHFQSLLHSNTSTTAPKRGNSNAQPNLPTQPQYSSPFTDVTMQIVHQVQGLSDELVLIAPLYVTPPPKPLFLQQQPARSPPTLHYNVEQDHSIISTMLHSAKCHSLSNLPPQWITIIDQSVKDCIQKLSDSITTMRRTLETQKTTLDNIYAPQSSQISKLLSTASRAAATSPVITIAINRNPMEKFIEQLKAYHTKLNKGKDPTPAQLQEYSELSTLSYQSVEHRNVVLTSLENVIAELGKQIISLERERKALAKQQSHKSYSKQLTSVLSDAAGESSIKAQLNSHNPSSSLPSLPLSTLSDNHTSSLRNRNNKSPRSRKSSVFDLESQDGKYDTNDDDDAEHELAKFGLSLHQLEEEQKNIQTSMEQEEFELAKTVEHHMQEISTLITTFQAHVLQQSETIDNIYQDVEAVNYNIDSGNTQLEEALTRGGCTVWFYTIVFLACAFGLLILDYLFN